MHTTDWNTQGCIGPSQASTKRDAVVLNAMIDDFNLKWSPDKHFDLESHCVPALVENGDKGASFQNLEPSVRSRQAPWSERSKKWRR